MELHLHFPFIYNEASATRLQSFVRFFGVQVDGEYKMVDVAWTNAKKIATRDVIR